MLFRSAAGFKNVAQQAADKTTTTTTDPKADAEAQRKAGLEKKLRSEDGQEFYEHEIHLNEKRKKLDTMRPPFCWNFFDDAQPVE